MNHTQGIGIYGLWRTYSKRLTSFACQVLVEAGPNRRGIGMAVDRRGGLSLGACEYTAHKAVPERIERTKKPPRGA